MLRLTLWLLMASLATAAVLRADDAPAKPPGKPIVAVPPAPDEDPFALPDGNDSTVLKIFLRKLAATQPEERTLEGILGHLHKMDTAAAQVMDREAGIDVILMAADIRRQVIELLTQFGDPQAGQLQADVLAKLKQDERPEAKKFAAKLEISSRIAGLPNMEPAEREKLIQELAVRLQAVEQGDDEALSDAVVSALKAAETLERMQARSEALAAYRLFAKYTAAKHDDRLTSVVQSMEGSARRLDLPGHPIEVSGTTRSGEKFDIANLKGKVVLLDFWATWCPLCVEAMPTLKQLYALYHDKGLEIVGINLDEDPAQLDLFLASQPLPWTTLFDAEHPGIEQNPIAVKYSINGLPLMILVDRDGKVVAMQNQLPAIVADIEQLLGPSPSQERAKPIETKGGGKAGAE